MKNSRRRDLDQDSGGLYAVAGRRNRDIGQLLIIDMLEKGLSLVP